MINLKAERAIIQMQYRIDTASQMVGNGKDGKAFEDMEMAIKALETLEKIKGIIREEEHYEVSNSFENPHPNQADYDAVHADKFNRIRKAISDMESTKYTEQELNEFWDRVLD